MSTLFMMIVAILALALLGIWLPVLWIVAAALLVVGLLYLLGAARSAAGGPTE